MKKIKKLKGNLKEQHNIIFCELLRIANEQEDDIVKECLEDFIKSIPGVIKSIVDKSYLKYFAATHLAAGKGQEIARWRVKKIYKCAENEFQQHILSFWDILETKDINLAI